MDRLDIDQTLIEELRAQYADIDNYEEEDEDALFREDVCPGSSLLRDDDVFVAGSYVRVVGPGNGRHYFLGYGDPEVGLCTYFVGDVRERIALDGDDTIVYPQDVPPPAPLEDEEHLEEEIPPEEE